MHGHGGGGCGEARGVELGPQVPAASAPPPPTLSFPMEEARAALSPRRAADVSCHVRTVLRTHALLKGGGRERRGCHHDRRSPGDRRVTAHGRYGSQCGEKCRDGRHDRAPLAAGGSPFPPPSATAAVGTGPVVVASRDGMICAPSSWLAGAALIWRVASRSGRCRYCRARTPARGHVRQTVKYN